MSTTTVTRVVEDDTSAEVVVDAPAATIVTTDVDDQQGQSHPAVEVMPASIVEQAQTSME